MGVGPISGLPTSPKILSLLSASPSIYITGNSQLTRDAIPVSILIDIFYKTWQKFQI